MALVQSFETARLESIEPFSVRRLSPHQVDRPSASGALPHEEEQPLARLSVHFSELWSQLVSASLRYNSTLDSEDGCMLVFRKSRNNLRHFSLTPREQHVFRATLLGQPQKVIAAEGNVAASTVANSLRSAMMKLGFRSRLEAAPLAALTSSHRYRKPNANDGFGLFAVRGGEFVFAKASRPNWGALGNVTASEREVFSMIASGKSNLQISEARSTTVGTVQNQVASLFRKLGVGNRFELLHAVYAAGAPAAAND